MKTRAAITHCLTLTWEVLDVSGLRVEAGAVPGAAHRPAPVIRAPDQRRAVVRAVRAQGPHLAPLPQQQHLQPSIAAVNAPGLIEGKATVG